MTTLRMRAGWLAGWTAGDNVEILLGAMQTPKQRNVPSGRGGRGLEDKPGRSDPVAVARLSLNRGRAGWPTHAAEAKTRPISQASISLLTVSGGLGLDASDRGRDALQSLYQQRARSITRSLRDLDRR
ncbi:hypothetical protein Dda_9204 [Drechslerella dactyloides]|uniref:Uncharacterized protein n=1 Tax=Drechslerella dactyloides TaxID=74499 RepID=A0AAD6IPX3_DREDA|nr:hypothetical protein Dda_9204 [Drechslerella dactyloides]